MMTFASHSPEFYDLVSFVSVAAQSSSAPFGLNFASGLSGLTNAVLSYGMPAIGAFFVMAAIAAFAEGHRNPEPYIRGAVACWIVPGLYRLMLTFTSVGPTHALSQASAYAGNVAFIFYGVWNLFRAIIVFSGVTNRRSYIGDDWFKYLLAAIACFIVSGLCALVAKAAGAA